MLWQYETDVQITRNSLSMVMHVKLCVAREFMEWDDFVRDGELEAVLALDRFFGTGSRAMGSWAWKVMLLFDWGRVHAVEKS